MSPSSSLHLSLFGDCFLSYSQHQCFSTNIVASKLLFDLLWWKGEMVSFRADGVGMSLFKAPVAIPIRKSPWAMRGRASAEASCLPGIWLQCGFGFWSLGSQALVPMDSWAPSPSLRHLLFSLAFVIEWVP